MSGFEELQNLKKMYKFLKENNSIVLFFSYAILQKEYELVTKDRITG